MAAVNVQNPFDYQLTEEALSEMTPPQRPLIPGNSWSFRIQITNAVGEALSMAIDEAVELIEMYLKNDLAELFPVVSRKSNVNRVGISPSVKQITPDANQTTVVLDENNKPVSGKGFVEIWFDPGDREALLEVVGYPYFTVVVTWASGEEETVLMGNMPVKRQAKD